MEGAKKRGRHRKNWLSDTTEWTRKNMVEVGKTTVDKSQRRTMVEKSSIELLQTDNRLRNRRIG